MNLGSSSRNAWGSLEQLLEQVFEAIEAANEELESYAETELQEFSQHRTIQELEVETNESRK